MMGAPRPDPELLNHAEEIGAGAAGVLFAVLKFFGVGERKRFHRENQTLLNEIKESLQTLRAEGLQGRQEVQGLRAELSAHIQHDENNEQHTHEFKEWVRGQLLRRGMPHF